MSAPEFDAPDHRLLQTLFAEEGLEFLGVASVDDGPDLVEARARYRRWLAEGRQGTMAYLERHEHAKYDPGKLLDGTRAVIVGGLGYHQPRPQPGLDSGLVARYAWGRDYHKVILKKLKSVADRLQALWPEAQFRSFTDTSPLDERWWAARAGASFTARNSLAINHRLGSLFLLGEILTTRAIPATPRHQGTCPSGCHRCQQVCPTGALDAQGQIEASLCISYLTIEHSGPIDDALKPKVGSWLFGCDLCQDVCPFNLKAPATKEPEFLAWKAGPELRLGDVLTLNPEDFTKQFGGSPVHRAGRNGLVRNACLVAGNTGQTTLLPVLAKLVNDPDVGVADAAAWAVRRLTAKEQG